VQRDPYFGCFPLQRFTLDTGWWKGHCWPLHRDTPAFRQISDRVRSCGRPMAWLAALIFSNVPRRLFPSLVRAWPSLFWRRASASAPATTRLGTASLTVHRRPEACSPRGGSPRGRRSRAPLLGFFPLQRIGSRRAVRVCHSPDDAAAALALPTPGLLISAAVGGLAPAVFR
jgi:hypothetical protein